MPKARSGHLIIGMGLAVMGYAVLIIAFSRQAERMQASAQAVVTGAAACGPSDTSDAHPAVTALSPGAGRVAPSQGQGPDGSFTALGSPEAGAADARPDADERAEGGEAGDARLFKFYPGGAAMSREEAQRLSSYGKWVARHPTASVTVEAFGDTTGTDAVNTGIAKHRLKVATTLLVRAGLSEERIAVTTVDVAAEPGLARSLRATASVPMSELERP